MIVIKEAVSKAEILEYVKFPFSLYKDSPYWIPPLISDEVAGFDKAKNPIFETADATFYLAYKDGKLAGRITAIVNWDEVNILGKKKVRFGWFDVIDDIEVTKALLERVYEFGRKHGMDHVEGPMGFSNLDKVGLLTYGFDQIGTMITWYNYPYYVEHLKQLGYVKEKEFIESIFSFSGVNPKQFEKAQSLIERRYGLIPRNFTKTSELMPRVDEMFDLFNECYAELSSFVPISEKQKAFFKKKYIDLINPEYIKFIDDSNGKMVAFTIVMPSLSKALQKAKGKLFPFGFIDLMRAKKKSKEVIFYLIGILPEYQNKGLTAIIFGEYYKVFKKNGVETCIRTPELEENHSIHNLWKNFEPVIHKRRMTFTVDL
ncbi:MAG: GTP cyclohydrolase [Flavobacterium sp.]|nr:MAG: GTP cyclohydrolase [Flavobacterium sp.]